MRRASFAPVLPAVLVVGALLSGCGNSADIWRDEFDARLDGVSASIEATLVEIEGNPTKPAQFRVYANLARELHHKSELIEVLSAPAKCAQVQIKGFDHIRSLALTTFQVHAPDFPMRMLRAGRSLLEDELGVLARIEREAETCA